jgi:GT2 family glycosyltransferase/glycosyltransferase involved in cell wall biosynthesis
MFTPYGACHQAHLQFPRLISMDRKIKRVTNPQPLHRAWLRPAIRQVANHPRLSSALTSAMRAMSKTRMLSSLGQAIGREIVRQLGQQYFDAEFYAQTSGISHPSAENGLEHYLRHGWQSGSNPHPLFDATHYIASQTDYPDEINPIAHFILIGCHRRSSPSPWFDDAFYAEQNNDVARSTFGRYDHFVRFGFWENRRSSPRFDPEGYLAAYPDARESKLPALLHYMRHGVPDGRPGVFGRSIHDRLFRLSKPRHAPEQLSGDTWRDRILKLPPREFDDTRNAKIDIIVPIYRDYALTMECIYQAIATTEHDPVELVVVDDCSPEPELTHALRRIADDNRITLLVNDENQGFVRSVNRGMQHNPDRDIVLLNSDAIVFGDWLSRMKKCAERDVGIATVTPFTNSGTICSYPDFLEDSPNPLELDYSEIDRIAATVNAGEHVDAPTGIGFCMFIKRAALDDIGYFDETAFGTGYGEENDFCLRGQARGWRDVIATDIFVRHVGGASFQGEKAGRINNAMKVLDGRYPSYHADVKAYCERDPARPYRARLDMSRLRRQMRDRNILIVSHTRGGGTEEHIQERVARLGRDGVSAFRLRADSTRPRFVRLFHQDVPDVPNLPAYDLSSEASLAELATILRMLEIREIDFHHLADFWPGAVDRFQVLARQAGLTYTFTAHDYLSICPRINLVDATGFYCGEPNSARCNQCLRKNGNEFGADNILTWRTAYGELLRGAADVIVPDQDVSNRLSGYFDGVKFQVVPHDDVIHAPAPKHRRSVPSPLRIGVIGAISPIKGLDVICNAARTAEAEGHDVQFVVVGYTSNDEKSAAYGIEITGSYENDQVMTIIEQSRLDAIFLPSVWPETFSYTLSIALRTGLPIIAFDIGAIARRLTATDRKLILPLETARDSRRLCLEIAKFTRTETPAATQAISASVA